MLNLRDNTDVATSFYASPYFYNNSNKHEADTKKSDRKIKITW